MFDNVNSATWDLFNQGVDIILGLPISDDLKARTIAHMLFIIVDGNDT